MDFFFPNLALGQVGEGKACILSDFDNQFFFSPKYHHLWMRFFTSNNFRWVRVMVFNVTLNNISAISWQPVLVVEEAGVHGENHRPWASNW
jgi:hypothetical protein